MCEANVFLITNGVEQEVMKEVLHMDVSQDGLVIRDLLGNQKELQAKIKTVNFINHKVILEEL